MVGRSTRLEKTQLGTVKREADLLHYELDTPFESIEGAQEYLKLLSATVLEARQDVEADARAQTDVEHPRRVQALQLVLYKLEQLEKHVRTSHRILNDLRTLRRLLLEERTATTRETVADATQEEIHQLDGAC